MVSPQTFAVVTLLDQLDPKEYNWQQVSVILPCRPLFCSDFPDLFSEIKENIGFWRIVSKFLMDQERAGQFWVNSQRYADLARYILEFLRDKWVDNTSICANTNAWIYSRRFTDIVDISTLIPAVEHTTYYEVGKLAFNLLLILLSRIKALRGSQVHEVTVLLQSHPALHLINNDPLELEKVKVAQAIEEFRKVWFLLHLVLFLGLKILTLIERKRCIQYLVPYPLGESTIWTT